MFLLRDILRCKQARDNSKLKMVIEITTQSQIRDFYEVRQSEIHSAQMEGRNCKNYGSDQQRLQISELHFDNLPYSTNVFVLENKIQDWGMLLSKFPYGSCAVDQRREVERVSSVYDLKASCSIQRFTLFLILSCSRKDCIGPEQYFPEFLLQDKGQSGGTKGSESRPIPSRRRDRLTNLRLLPGHWRQWIRTRLYRLVYGCSSEWQHSVNGAILCKLRIRGSGKLKIVFELYNLEIHQKKAKPDYHKLKTIVKKWATFEVTKLRG